jgi:hypothetical protein
MMTPTSHHHPHVQRCVGSSRCTARVTWCLGDERGERLLACDLHRHLVKAQLERNGELVLVQPIGVAGPIATLDH